MSTTKPKTLQQRFLASFAGQVLSSKEIFSWFTAQHEEFPDQSSMHRILINPLMHSKLLTRMHQGLYRVNATASVAKTAKQVLEAEDKWNGVMKERR